MDRISLKDLAVPIIKSIDSFNYLLKSHHRRTAVASYAIAKKMGLSNEDLFELVVAAGLHDIGALSIQERDLLVQEDVVNPTPHCIMGHRMLESFDAFENIAQIIRHHHIRYQDSLDVQDGEVLFQSHIIHLADRVDVLINPDNFILNQKEHVTETIRAKVGTTFHPDVFEAFNEVSKADVFWFEINNLEMDQLFRRLDVSVDFELTIDNIIDFALTLSRIIDFRSRFTASHSYTVAHLSSFLGKYLGFSEEGCKKLLVSGYLHDIGKIGIDPELIEKKGPLSDEEYNLVKLHAYYTGQILNELSQSPWFREIVTWAERHHEKSDGTGYPHALDESSLDVGAKIIAFSDVISALLEERPYRKGMSIDKAFNIIRNEIAPSISPSMFQMIEQHKDEINELVVTCHNYSFNE
ncbi:HD-GYP domain-containing protein [Halodesulfovibrio marinisediminis]|uniref:HD domain-containing protein n=1 Tax=Halodesulfovibrio marinisediminis DSM 17456 TaxID=1121457 RepID=A0A1N6EBM5_9BACT|nr:HD domain-containing phosphohydrolase [Halodesulfovibrio marinisediminis]SIN80396.1 HD domain-containing protein [Halodesulfovibrio marinisediminis DSM 17456]